MANSVGSGQQEKRKKKGKLDIVVCVCGGVRIEKLMLSRLQPVGDRDLILW